MPRGVLTRFLNDAAAGDPDVARRLLPIVYDELRKLAAHRISQVWLYCEIDGQPRGPIGT